MDYNKCRKAIGWTALRKVYQQGILDRTADLLNAILCCKQVHTNAYQKKNGDKLIFDMACLRIFCMKSAHSLCIHYAASMDKYFGRKVQTATDPVVCKKLKKARKIDESYRQQGRDRDAHERRRSPKLDAPVRSCPAGYP